ncbi:DUF6259 domain-containing protein [uncultured Maribacter sp.]|uniref:DUF6259 domain-containing protein n=1 Tax=uncultured Maribacter sp. TaxID=431308 RepID=UPI0030EE13CE|tara:strand:- start:2617 stop:4752 length:2136 start_codon:yes stop_codon:yes gene_type:complete
MKTNFFNLKLVLAFLFIVTQSFNGISQKVYTIKNQNVEFAIDETGNLVSLKNLQSGHNYATGGPIWRMLYDTKKTKDIEVLGKDNLPSIQQEGNKIQLVYASLKAGNKDLNFKLVLKMILENDFVRFSSEVKNNESHTIIRELQYPLVSDCQVAPDHQLLTTEMGGRLYPDPIKKILSIPYSYKGPDQHFRQMEVIYPVRTAANCFALVGKDQGLYFGSHDPTYQDTWHGLRVYPDENKNFNRLEMGIYKYPNCLSGETWKNDANVIAPYSGNWHETSKIYRAWTNTWWDHRDEPLWVKQMNGFQRIIMRHQYGETLFTYDELATNVKKAGESVGINVVFPFGWWDSGMDNGYPDSYFVTDPEQGGDRAWKKAIADFQQGDGKVMLYYNGKLIDTESAYYRKGVGSKVSFTSNTGTEINEAYRFSGPGTFTGKYNTRTFVVANTSDSRWQKQLLKMADHALEMGANSVFYDQLGYAEDWKDWDLTKEFPVPNLRIIADKANALKMIHDHIETKNRELAIGIEHITDVTSQYVDYVHSILYLDRNDFFIDWYRYTFPEIILTGRNIDGDEPNIKWLVNQNVLLGLRNNLQIYRLRETIDKTPIYQEHLAKVNLLKDKYKSLLVMGTYKDTEGFSIDDKGVIKGRSFVNGNRMAIVLAHTSNHSEATKVSVPGYWYVESESVGDIKVDLGSDGAPTVIIGVNGLVALIYEKIN